MAKKEKIKGENEDAFRSWLEKRLDDTGQAILKPKTQGAYFSSLKNSITRPKLKEKYRSYKSVFDIVDLHEFEEIVEAIKADEEAYKAYNTHYNFSNGIKEYKAFLAGEGPMPKDLRKKGRPLKKEDDPGPKGKNEPDPSEQNPRNWIFFGAPGTGKSYTLNDKKNTLLDGHDERCTRVTFHPDYSYAHFVGTYKPKAEGSKGEIITYRYVPGPFMEIYVKATEDPDNEYVLIIEEINRANVAAVFGDVFQLLDRTKTGESEYPVKASEDIQDYLKNRGWASKDYEWIRIPGNMYIWGTMNSADQGVFPMDTAFKRRWEFEYLPITTGEDAKIIKNAMVPMGEDNTMIKWNDVRKDINDLLARLGINEDKQLGTFFINAEIIANAAASKKGGDRFKATFKDKVLMYLFEDAAKHKRKEVFGTNKDNGNKRYSEIREAFDKTGMGVFEGLKKKTGNGKTKPEGEGGTAGMPATEGDAGEQEP